MGFFRQGYWSGFPFSFSRGSARPRDQTSVSYLLHCRLILYLLSSGLINATYLPARWSQTIDWQGSNWIVADSSTANIASFICSELVAVTASLRHIDTKSEWNPRMLGWCGWVRGPGRPGPCALHVKRKAHHCPCPRAPSCPSQRLPFPAGWKRKKQSWTFPLQLKHERPFILKLFWYHRPKLYHHEANPTWKHSSKSSPF